jgi:ABC-type transport system involved in multi-copper enzyme maturation permease subunit
MNPIISLTRKETGELFSSGRGLAWLTALTVVLSVLSLLLVSNTELSLLDNAQVVYMVMGTIAALGGLLAVVSGSDSFAGERERGTLIPLLLTPLQTAEIVQGKMSGLFVAWAVTFLLSLPYLWAVGSGGQNLFQAILALALFGTPLVLGFGFLSLGLSARFNSVRTALSTSLIALALLASPVLLGPGLRQTVIGRIFDAVNPFSAALNSFDSIVIDSQTFLAQGVRFAVVLIWFFLAMVFAGRSARNMEI